METIARRILFARERRGLSQERLAAAIGVTQTAISDWERGKEEPRRANLRALARALDFNEVWLAYGEGQPLAGERGRELGDEFGSEARGRAAPREGARDLPVYGSARGGFDGEEIQADQPIGRMRRPPQLEGVKEGMAVIVVGSSMEPRYFAGEVVFIDPRLPCRPGDYVLVELADFKALIKRLLRIDAQMIEIAQHNPEEKRKIPRAKVRALARIVGAAPSDSY